MPRKKHTRYAPLSLWQWKKYRPAPGNKTRSEIMSMKMPKNLGMLLLAIWLILYGLLTAPFLHFSFTHAGDILALLAIVTGALLLLQR